MKRKVIKKRRLKKWVKVVLNIIVLIVLVKVMTPKAKVQIKTITKEKEPMIILVKEPQQEKKETTKKVEIVEETKELITEEKIYNRAIEKGLTKNQALIVVSISRHETGNWTSKAFNEKNNFGGIMCNGATEIKSYETFEEGLDDFIRVLKTYYFDEGLETIAEIGAKYCPVGAENDPNGLNKYWVSGVSAFYTEYSQKGM